MADIAENIADFIELFDDLREEFFPDDSNCYLLSGDGLSEAFAVKLELNGGWFLKYSEFRGFFKLLYATTDASFAKVLKASGYVAVGGDVYKIEEGDTVPPMGNKPFWKVACQLVGGKKFFPPEI